VEALEYPYGEATGEIPIGACLPIEVPRTRQVRTVAGDLVEVLDGGGVTITHVEGAGALTTWTLEPSVAHEDKGPRGAEFAPGGSSNIAGVVVVHSGHVTARSADGDTLHLGPGRWILR
jgi:hypothetical protein